MTRTRAITKQILGSFFALSICALAAPAVAQHQPPGPVTISGALAQAVVTHLTVGGTFSAGQNLAQQIIDASNAPAKAADDEKALRAKIEAEIKAASSGTSMVPTEPPPIPPPSPPEK